MKLTSKQIGIAVTALITAILHLLAAFDRALFPAGPDPLFILNGLGYLGLLGAYFLPIRLFQQRHRLVRWVLIGYAILTIVAWIWIYVIQFVILGGTPFFSRDAIYGLPAKIAEVLLIAFLWSDK
jgi:hypothetical protein